MKSRLRRLENKVKRLEEIMAPVRFQKLVQQWKSRRIAESSVFEPANKAWLLHDDRKKIWEITPPYFPEDYVKDYEGIVYRLNVKKELESLSGGANNIQDISLSEERPSRSEVTTFLIKNQICELDKNGYLMRLLYELEPISSIWE